MFDGVDDTRSSGGVRVQGSADGGCLGFKGSGLLDCDRDEKLEELGDGGYVCNLYSRRAGGTAVAIWSMVAASDGLGVAAVVAAFGDFFGGCSYDSARLDISECMRTHKRLKRNQHHLRVPVCVAASCPGRRCTDGTQRYVGRLAGRLRE